MKKIRFKKMLSGEFGILALIYFNVSFVFLVLAYSCFTSINKNDIVLGIMSIVSFIVITVAFSVIAYDGLNSNY